MKISIFKYKISEDENVVQHEVNSFIRELGHNNVEIIDIDVILQKKYLVVVIKHK